jgi:protein gp37
MRLAARYPNGPFKDFAFKSSDGHAHWTGKVMTLPHKLNEPRKLPKPSRVFVNSMSDAFHKDVPDSFLREMFAVMNETPQHTYQILTKRPERASDWPGPWTPNIWMGTSVEDDRVIHRIDTIRKCKALTRFISAEPLIGPLTNLDLTGIHWVIVGGESGPGYRSMDMQWARNIRDQCVEAGVAYFFKQDSSARTETRCYLVEEDGRCFVWHQWPDAMNPPVEVEPDNPKFHQEHFRILGG